MYLRTFSENKASVYSIATEEIEGTLFDRFLVAYKSLYLENVLDILGRLRSIGEVGAKEHYFKMDEGLHTDDLVCALFDLPDKNLRLYCIRLYKHIVIVGMEGLKMCGPGRMM